MRLPVGEFDGPSSDLDDGVLVDALAVRNDQKPVSIGIVNSSMQSIGLVNDPDELQA